MPNSSGTLRVRTYTAGGALPVPNAVVRVIGTSEDVRLVSYSSLTDRDGLSDLFVLPTPDVGYSMSPNPAELPYSLYDIEVTADGYFTKKIKGVSLFPEINSILLVNMTPGSGKMIEEYPRGSVNYIIPENTDLN